METYSISANINFDDDSYVTVGISKDHKVESVESIIEFAKFNSIEEARSTAKTDLISFAKGLDEIQLPLEIEICIELLDEDGCINIVEEDIITL